MKRRSRSFPPYELVDSAVVESTADKTRRLERLYHLTQQRSWDGKQLLADLIERHGPPGSALDRETRESLSRVMTLLMWGELAAWDISADLALEIDDMDAKMAATAQVFDEARHFYVMRDYVLGLGPAPRLGGIPRRLLEKVVDAPSLAAKLVGMQLLFETNAVVIFRGIADGRVCPILTELLPYFERDESRHVGLGVMYLPRLIQGMSRTEALWTRKFQMECIALLIGGGFTIRDDFARLGLSQRQMAQRVTRMQDDIVRQMADEHGGALAAVMTKGDTGYAVIDFIHPEGGLDALPRWHRAAHRGIRSAVGVVDRALS